MAVHVRFDHSSKQVIVDLSRRYVPKCAGSQLEDLEAELGMVVEELLRGLADFSGVHFNYDGKSVQYFYPDPPRPMSHWPSWTRWHASSADGHTDAAQ